MTRTTIIFTLGVVVAVQLAAADDHFDQALASAKRNAETPEGATYDATIGKTFGERHASTMARCTESASGPDLQTFDLLMKVDKDGAVEEAIVRPDTKVAACLRKAVASDKYPGPPEPNYWVHIHMAIAE